MSARRKLRKLCAACLQRHARFTYRGRVRADRDHVLCFQCFRAEVNRARVRRLAEADAREGAQAPRLFGRATELTPAQLAHRARMLAHLGARRATRS